MESETTIGCTGKSTDILHSNDVTTSDVITKRSDMDSTTEEKRHETNLLVEHDDEATLPGVHANNVDKYNDSAEGSREKEHFIRTNESNGLTSPAESASKRHEHSTNKTIYHTVCSYTIFISLGLISASIGPSLIDLQELLYTDTKTIVVLFPCLNAGMLGGTIISAYLLGKINDTFLFFVAGFAMSIAYMLSVWTRHLVVFCLFMVVMAMSMASINCTLQVTILRLWMGSKHQNSVLQAGHFIWSVGATSAPFIIEPFLSNERGEEHSNGTSSNITFVSEGVYLNSSTSETMRGNVSYETDSNNLLTRIQFGFLTIGVITLVPVILLFITLNIEGWIIRKNTSNVDRQEKRSPKKATLFKSVMLIGISLLMFFYSHLENASINLLATFVVEGLQWEKFTGPLVTSVFCAMFAIGRLVGIFLSRLITPAQILYLDSSVVCFGYIILMAFINLHEAVVWVSVSLAGLGMGSFAATGFTFLNLYLPVDGLASSCIIGSFAVSAMTMTPLTGVVFATYGPMSMVYILFVSSTIVLLVFIALHTFARRFVRTSTNRDAVLNDVNDVTINCHSK